MKNTKSNINKRNLFQTAWNFFKQGLFNSFANALQAAWKRIKLISNLRHGIAYFSYLKASGEVRQAIGTLAGSNFSYTNKTENHNTKSDVIKYWDINSKAWRSFRIERLLTVA